MRKHLLVATLLLGITAISALPQYAQNAPNEAEQPSPRGWTAITLLRFINTREVVYQHDHGAYGDWDALLADENFADKVMKALAQHEPQFAGAQLSQGPEILPGWRLRFHVHADENGYDVFLEDTSDANKSYAAMTDERGVIWECKTI
jgi:hypothetical protein